MEVIKVENYEHKNEHKKKTKKKTPRHLHQKFHGRNIVYVDGLNHSLHYQNK